MAKCFVRNLQINDENLKGVKTAQVKNKTVLLRADLDVPIQNGQIADDSRLKAWLPTLQLSIGRGCQNYNSRSFG